jgi:hypothetical protein
LRRATVVTRRPVDLARAALDDATNKLRQVLAITTRWVAGTDGHSVERLAIAAAAAIHRGEAARGLRLTALLEEAGVALGRARDRHFTPSLSELAELTVRLTAVGGGSRAVRCEHLYVSWARAGRERNSLATDRVRQVTPGMRFAGVAISCDDRHLSTLEVPFVTGTRHDRMSARADEREIARLTGELGREPNSSPAEHFEELLEVQCRARSRIADVDDVDGGAALLERIGFCDLVVAGGMPCGPAPRRSLDGARTYWPGCDAALIEVLRRAGKRGVAQLGRTVLCGPSSPLRRELVRAGFVYRRCPYSTTDARLANEAEWNVDWYWNATSRCLARVAVERDTTRVDSWRVVELDDELEVAVALVRRHEQSWPHEFMRQTLRDTGPGLIKASSYRSDAALRDLLRVAIAGLVDAERRAMTWRRGDAPG